MKKINIIISVILMSLACVYYYLIGNLPDRDLANTLSSAFMPTLLCYFIMFLSAVLLVKNIRYGTAESCSYHITKKEMLGLLYVALIIYFYVFLMKIAGFIFITPVVMIILMRLTGSVKWKEMITVSVAATVLIYFFFNFLFRVQLPHGILM